VVQRRAIVGRLAAIRDQAHAWSWWPYRALLLAVLVWVAQRRLSAVWPFTIDDAGISYAYAKHLAEGAGPVAVVGGPWVEGYSNPLWVFLLVPWHWLGLEIPSVAKVLGVVLFGVAALLGAAALAQRREAGWRSCGALEASLAVALVSCVQILIWVVAGLENSLFWALLAGLWYLDGRESRRPGAFGLSGLVAFGLCITRPEAPLYVAPWAALQLLQAWREPAQRRRVLRALLLYVVPFVLYHALHYAVFRAWVPNTFHAKTSSWSWQDGSDYLINNLRDSGLLYVLPLAVVGLWGRSRLELLLACNCLTGVAFILYAGGDWMPHGRFLSLVAPAVLLLAAGGLEQLVRGLGWAARGRAPREAFSLLLGAGAIWVWWGRQELPLQAVTRKPWCHFCERVSATEAIQRLSRRAGIVHPTLLTQDFGGPAWLSSERLYPIDFLGLCDRNVALLRHSMVSRRKRISSDFRFYQYLIHEQPWAPTWISLPSNFWGALSASPEYRWDYFRLDWQLVPYARSPYFALHRGELVDYFPSVPRADFRPFSPHLALNGAAYFAPREARGEQRVAPGAQVTVLASLLPRARLAGDEQVELRVEAGGVSVQSPPQPLLRGLPDIAYQLSRGEPLRVELTLALPEAQAERYRVQLGVVRRSASRAGEGPTWLELEPLVVGAALPPEQRILPPYPAALPPAQSAELSELRAAVTTQVERRRRSVEPIESDAALIERLLALGGSLELAGQESDAYLAYVWATQLDPRVWEKVSDVVFRLRPVSNDDWHPLELALLQDYYSTGSVEALAALVAFYIDGRHLDEARYFLQLRPAETGSAPLWAALESALQDGQGGAAVLSLVARDPLGGALTFDVPGLAGWQGDVATYHSGPPTPQGELGAVRGFHGSGALSSGSRNDPARGTITSPPFVLQGRRLSVLVGGGARRQRVGVELLVDDVVVQSASGVEGDFLYPWLWDITEHQGKHARLRVFDRSKDAHVLVDRVLLWN
jgi:hypothetical protein